MSVSAVARAHDINANLLFNRRKLYRRGLLKIKEESESLLPVKISDALEKRKPAIGHSSKRTIPGTIDIELGHARVRIEGAADPERMRAAVEGLLR
jgi:transposase